MTPSRKSNRAPNQGHQQILRIPSLFVLLLFLLLFLLLLAISSCTEQSQTIQSSLILSAPQSSPQSNPTKPIRIGALFPLTGGLSQYGEAAEHAARLAMNEINANGGINGKALEIDFQDHACNPKTAVTIFEQLNSAKEIKVFTSAACSGTVLAIAPLLKSNNTNNAILLGTIITTPKITGLSPYVFRNWASDAKQAKLYADTISKRGYLKVGVIYEQTDYAQGLYLSLQQFLHGTGILVIGQGFEPGATDVRTQLTKLQQVGIDALFISPQTVTSGDVVLKQMRELTIRPRGLFVNDNILKAKELLSRYPDILEGAQSGDYTMEQAEPYHDLMILYKKTYGVECPQTNICAGVYDAIHLLSKAIKENGEDPIAISQYLSTISYEGASGHISFDKNNDREGADYTLFSIEGGRAIPNYILKEI